jgi:hypothetical protein
MERNKKDMILFEQEAVIKTPKSRIITKLASLIAIVFYFQPFSWMRTEQTLDGRVSFPFGLQQRRRVALPVSSTFDDSSSMFA